MNEKNMSFGEKLKKSREHLNLTQLQLSEKLGISKSALGMYETNKREPDLVTINNLCKILEVDGNWLLGINTKYNLQLDAKEKLLVKTYRELNDEGKKYIMLTMTMAKEKFSAESAEKENKEYIYGNIAAFGGGTKKVKYTKKEAKEAVEAIDQFHYLSMTEDDEE